jgi:hypothetical protein
VPVDWGCQGAASEAEVAAASITAGDENTCCTKAAMFCMVGGRRNAAASTFREGEVGESGEFGESELARCISAQSRGVGRGMHSGKRGRKLTGR